MNQTALVAGAEAVRDDEGNILYGKILSGIGYNLSAMGKND